MLVYLSIRNVLVPIHISYYLSYIRQLNHSQRLLLQLKFQFFILLLLLILQPFIYHLVIISDLLIYLVQYHLHLVYIGQPRLILVLRPKFLDHHLLNILTLIIHQSQNTTKHLLIIIHLKFNLRLFFSQQPLKKLTYHQPVILPLHHPRFLRIHPPNQLFLLHRVQFYPHILNQSYKLRLCYHPNILFIHLPKIFFQLDLHSLLIWFGSLHNLNQPPLITQQVRMNINKLMLLWLRNLPQYIILPLISDPRTLISSTQIKHSLPHQQLLSKRIINPFLNRKINTSIYCFLIVLLGE